MEDCCGKLGRLCREIENANFEMEQFQKQMLLQIDTIVNKHVPELLDNIQRALTAENNLKN